MHFNTALESKSVPKIKKAAANIAKDKIDGYENILLIALEFLMDKPKSWQAQSQVIRTIGIVGSNKSLPYLRELAQRSFTSSVLYKDLGFSLCMLEDIANENLIYLKSILNNSNVQLLSGACSAILYSGFTPTSSDIVTILDSVISEKDNEGQIITPRCYIAAACHTWPQEITATFLTKCLESSWEGLVEIANDSLVGTKTSYVLV